MTHKHTARFWMYVNDGLVKLSIASGSSISFRYGGPHEEGYSYTEVTMRYRNGIVTKKSYTSACDCDGPLESWNTSQADINVRVYLDCFEPVPPEQVLKFERVSGHQRDHYAEAMGY